MNKISLTKDYWNFSNLKQKSTNIISQGVLKNKYRNKQNDRPQLFNKKIYLNFFLNF